MGWLTSAAIRESRLLKSLLKIVSYTTDVNGVVTGLASADGTSISPYEFTLTEFNNLTASDYIGVTVRVTNLHSTAAGVGGVYFTGGASWILESTQLYYATHAAGKSAFPAASWPGLRMTFGDVGDGRVPHVSDGTRYAPISGRFTLFRKTWGSIASPTLNTGGGTSFIFTLAASAPALPANYLVASDQIQIKARFQKHGAVATAPTYIRLGTNGSATDDPIWAVSLAATDRNHTGVDCYLDVVDATHYTTNSSSAQSGGGGTGQLLDKTTGFNIASPMIFSVTGTKNTADTVDLLSLTIEIITAP